MKNNTTRLTTTRVPILALAVSGGLVAWAPAAEAAQSGYTLSDQERAVLAQFVRDEVQVWLSGGDAFLFTAPMTKASAVDLAQTYKRNQVAGDQRFFKKLLHVEGRVASIQSGLANRPYLLLSGPDQFLRPQAHFPQTAVPRIAQLAPGAQVSIVCTGGGVIVGTPVLQECAFADEYAAGVTKKIEDTASEFLAGRSVKSKQVPILAVMAIATARIGNPDSKCLAKWSSCSQTLLPKFRTAEGRKVTITVIDTLKAAGIAAPSVESVIPESDGQATGTKR